MGRKRRTRNGSPPVAPIAAINLREAAEDRYLAYALSVITSRALPDVRDGLKPVQRRILYAMFRNLHLTPTARPRKSAAVVGEVLGKYHPHGDLAAYEAMVRMAQPFALRYPLVHGEGNFGSLDGDNAAAMRYTEARLAPIAEELLRDIREETVDFHDNYDATLQEPIVLPAAIPQLLINGSTGIAVGMATNIPPHNLREIVKALLALIEDPKLETKDLCKFVRGPDFPTGGEILNSSRELREIYESGHGPVRLRGSYVLEREGRTPRIVITSVPYMVNKSRLLEEIAAHIVGRQLPQATDVRDESTSTVRIVVEIKSDASPETVMAYLFKHTCLQLNFHVNLTALVPTKTTGIGQPARLTLKELCRHFLDFRLEVVTRRLEHEKRALETRLHILEGFLKLFDALDEAIRIIRSSASRGEAREALMTTFALDETQADAILETRLYQLARLEMDKIRTEQKEKRLRLREIQRLLKSTPARWKLVAAGLEEVAATYGDARRTRLYRGTDLVYDAEAYVVHEDATVVVTRDGWMKRVGELKDPASTRVREGDIAQWVLRGTTRHLLGIFSNQGCLYMMKVANVPATTGYGEPVQSMLNFKDGEAIVAVELVEVPAASADATAPVAQGPGQGSLNFVPSHGRGRTTDQERRFVATAGGMGFFCRPDMSETTRSGRRVARVKEGDEVIAWGPATGDAITAATSSGKVLSFAASELAELSGPGRGVILMRLDAGDRVVAALCHARDCSPLAVDNKGKQHRLQLTTLGRRAQKGRKVGSRYRLAGLTPRV